MPQPPHNVWTEPIYETIVDNGDSNVQINASYQVSARIDLIINEAYTNAGVVAQDQLTSTQIANYKPAVIMGTAKTLKDGMEENKSIDSTHTRA